MRVCFDGLCFASQRLAEDDEAGMISVGAVQNGHPVVEQAPKEAMAAPPDLQALQALLQSRDDRIEELEKQLRLREEEIVQLRSHLDKFKSVFPYHVAQSPKHNIRPRKQRNQGISAEPQSESTLQELAQQTFPTFDKNER